MKKVLYMGIATAILFVFLTVPAFANDSAFNLIDSDLLQWDTYIEFGHSDSITVSQLGANSNWAQIGFTHSEPYFSQYSVMGAKFDLPSDSLVAGKSYTLSFYVPSDSEIQSSYPAFTTALLDQRYDKLGGLMIGVGYQLADGSITALNENSYVTLKSDNRQSYAGKVNYITFVMPDSNQANICVYVGGAMVSASANESVYLVIGRRYTLVDNEKKDDIEQYNRIWYGNSAGDYTNPFTTENYDLGPASDTSELASAFDTFEDSLDNLSAPFRITGRLLNDIFGHDSPLAVIGVIVFLVLILAVVFRLFGVT